MQEIAIAFIVVALLAFAGVAVSVQSSLSFWRNDESFRCPHYGGPHTVAGPYFLKGANFTGPLAQCSLSNRAAAHSAFPLVAHTNQILRSTRLSAVETKPAVVSRPEWPSSPFQEHDTLADLKAVS